MTNNVPCLSLISISSYVVQGTEETGNIYSSTLEVEKSNWVSAFQVSISFWIYQRDPAAARIKLRSSGSKVGDKSRSCWFFWPLDHLVSSIFFWSLIHYKKSILWKVVRLLTLNKNTFVRYFEALLWSSKFSPKRLICGVYQNPMFWKTFSGDFYYGFVYYF